MQLLITRLQFSRSDRLIRMAILLSASCFTDPHRILNRLKFSNHDKKVVLTMISLRHAPLDTIIDIRRIMRSLSIDFIQYLQYREGMDRIRLVQAHAMYEQIIRNHDCTDLKDLVINGSDLVKLGYKGKEISTALNDILEKVIEEKLPNDHNILLDYLSSRTS